MTKDMGIVLYVEHARVLVAFEGHELIDLVPDRAEMLGLALYRAAQESRERTARHLDVTRGGKEPTL